MGLSCRGGSRAARFKMRAAHERPLHYYLSLNCEVGLTEAQPGEHMSNVTMRQMLEAGVHFGHQTRFWNPKMAPYIYGKRNRIHIVNLEKTLPMLNDAMNFIGSIAANKGRVLFVGTKTSAQEAVAEEARRCGMPFISHRWLGGLLTNYKTIRHLIKRLKELDEMFEKEAFVGLTKKEILNLTREREKLERSIGGIKNMGGLPDALFVIDVGYEDIAVTEARKLSIPIVGVVDTNSNPEHADYIIPGNDDAVRAIRLYAAAAADAVLDARQGEAVDLAAEFGDAMEDDEVPAVVTADLEKEE